jgi:hypothetical protein
MANFRFAIWFLFTLFLPFSSVRAGNTLENPHETFSIAKVNSNNIALTVIASKNVQATCDAESKKRGYGGFGRSVEACSFWDASSFNNKCTVVLPEVTNFHTIGHELRHCLKGNWHK